MRKRPTLRPIMIEISNLNGTRLKGPGVNFLSQWGGESVTFKDVTTNQVAVNGQRGVAGGARVWGKGDQKVETAALVPSAGEASLAYLTGGAAASFPPRRPPGAPRSRRRCRPASTSTGSTAGWSVRPHPRRARSSCPVARPPGREPRRID